MQDKYKKLVEPYSPTSHLTIRANINIYQLTFLVCVRWMCRLPEYVSEVTNPFGLMGLSVFLLLFFCTVTLALACVLFYMFNVNHFCKKRRKYLRIVLMISHLLAKARL